MISDPEREPEDMPKAEKINKSPSQHPSQQDNYIDDKLEQVLVQAERDGGAAAAAAARGEGVGFLRGLLAPFCHCGAFLASICELFAACAFDRDVRLEVEKTRNERTRGSSRFVTRLSASRFVYSCFPNFEL
jgi:hypothetical protein